MKMLKNISLIIIMSFIAFSVKAQSAVSKVAYLDEGNTINEYPAVKWLKGEPVTHLDKDKIYIVELWATWCVPCIDAMPHLNDLNNKFKDKNIVFIAQDVLENDTAKVIRFVNEKGSAFGFRFAFCGPAGSDFDTKWVKAAGVTSIPQTFVIQNNILVWETRPSMLNEKVLQLLADHKFTIEAAEALQ